MNNTHSPLTAKNLTGFFWIAPEGVATFAASSRNWGVVSGDQALIVNVKGTQPFTVSNKKTAASIIPGYPMDQARFITIYPTLADAQAAAKKG